MKIVLNKCYGGFSLSEIAIEKLGLSDEYPIINRSDAILIDLVEKDVASGRHAKLRVVEIPDDATDWEIDEYDGFEVAIYVVDGHIHRV